MIRISVPLSSRWVAKLCRSVWTVILQAKALRRAAEKMAELGNRVHIGSLRRRRQVADHHVVDHAAAKGVVPQVVV
jgi:ribosomal protein L17